MKQLIILALCGYVLGFFHGINSIKKIDTKDFIRCYEMNDWPLYAKVLQYKRLSSGNVSTKRKTKNRYRHR
jgi:hypothetical protein